MSEDSTKYLEELKELIVLHINTQGIKDKSLLKLIDSIETDDQGENSWATLWMRKGDAYQKESRYNEAMVCYNFGRFPYVNGDNRYNSHKKCIELFKKIYKVGKGELKEKTIYHKDLEIPVYLSGEWTEKRPLLLVMGGIVSIKEQWGQFIKLSKIIGYTTCLAELPSVGENPLTYNKNSYQYIDSIIDQLSMGKNNLKAALCGISFSGELMLKVAARNNNIIGVICSGSPINNFFTDSDWLSSVPITTIKTLTHITKLGKDESLYNKIKDFRISTEELQKIKAPVRYIACNKDNIIPPSETEIINQLIEDSQSLMLDDIHGGPHSMKLIRLYIITNLCRFIGKDKGIIFKIINFYLKLNIKKNKAILI